jgi:hypothetical protein
MATKYYPKAIESAVLTVYIDGSWDAIEFALLFDSLQRLYSFYCLLDSSTSSIAAERSEFGLDVDITKLPKGRHIGAMLIRYANQVFQMPNNTINPGEYRMVYLTHAPYYALKVTKVQFNSPGSIDVIGFGKALEHLKEMLMHYLPNKSAKLDNVIKEKQIEEKELELLQKRIQVLKELGLSMKDIIPIIGLESLHLKNISDMQERQMVTGINISRDSQE